MSGVEQLLQDPAAMVVLLVAGAAGALLVLFVALFLLRGRDRELRALRVDHSLERDRRARLEVEKETLGDQVISARAEADRLHAAQEATQEQLSEARNLGTRLEAEKIALDERLNETLRERDGRAQERDALRAQLGTTSTKITELESQVQHGEQLRQQLENAENRLRESFRIALGQGAGK